MSKLKEIKSDVFLANRLLDNMNQKLCWVVPEKKEAVDKVMLAIAYEIYAAFYVQASKQLLILDHDGKLKGFTLFDTMPLLQNRVRVNPLYLKERIYEACRQKEILLLILNDIDGLFPICADLIKIIEKFIAEEERQCLSQYWEKALLISTDENSSFINQPPKLKYQHSKIPFVEAIEIKYSHYEKPYHNGDLTKIILQKSHPLYNISFFHKNNLLQRNRANQNHANLDFYRLDDHGMINFLHDHNYVDLVNNLVRLLRRNLTIVRFLLVLFDRSGNRLIQLTQLNLLEVCNAVAEHEVNLQINADRLDRLYYLCSQSKKFSDEVTNWMRMYQHHCEANDTPLSFPELLLTFCANHPEYVDDRGPLSLQTLCAKILRDNGRQHQIPYAHVQDLVDEESIQPNGIGDDEYVLTLLTDLVGRPRERQHLRLGM